MRALLVASLLLGGCLVATRPAGRPVYVEEERCPSDRDWDGHKCKEDKEAKREDKEERKEEKQREKDDR